MIFLKTNTIKYKIFQYNILTITVLMVLVAVVFSVAIHLYMEKETISQLEMISARTATLTAHQGLVLRQNMHSPASAADSRNIESQYTDKNTINQYIMLNRALKEPLSLLNAEYILLDKEKNIVTLFPDEYRESPSVSDQMVEKVEAMSDHFENGESMRLKIADTNYIAIVQPLSVDKATNSGWIIIYASLENINHLQFMIYRILFLILVISLLAVVLISSKLSKKLTEPFVYLNDCIKAIAERDFGNQIGVPVYAELSETVRSINAMSQKLDYYDKAQKTFLQNASHEFRTPLMSIQSYAEGIKFSVVDSNTAADIILDESKRMADLVEELLYLSRLESTEEKYEYKKVNLAALINMSIDCIYAIAVQNKIQIQQNVKENIEMMADERKFSQAIVNILSNCIRYAKTTVAVEAEMEENKLLKLTVWDDGPGFDTDELQNIFERFYKGKKGNFGLGLAISKSIIQKHNGMITAQNRDSGGAVFIINILL